MLGRVQRVGYLLGFLCVAGMVSAQEITIRGIIVDAITQESLENIEIRIENTANYTFTDSTGEFDLSVVYLSDPFVLQVLHPDFITKRLPVRLSANQLYLNLGAIELETDWDRNSLDVAQISLTDDELEETENSAYTISGLLSSTDDEFYKAAAYDFSSGFFNPRGLDNSYGKVLINGIAFNRQVTGRPEWASFGGLNDLMRNQTFAAGIEENEYQFGGIAGTSHTLMRASQYRKGGKVSYAQANRTYRSRFMASYSSGLQSNGWSYAFLLSYRYGNHGFQEGTIYDAQSVLLGIEKELTKRHSLNLLTFYTPYKRGKTTALTEEVKNLKGIHYNPLWGKYGKHNRNSRYKEVNQPVILLNHYWKLNDNTRLNTNLGYQFGRLTNSRIDNGGTRLVTSSDGEKYYVGGGKNPLPDYYQNLPSYFLRNTQPDSYDFQKAYEAEKELLEQGQLDWNSLYQANSLLKENGGNAVYVLQDDVEYDRQITLNTILNTSLSNQLKLDASVNSVFLTNRNYARIRDLLGADSYLDIDFFADEPREATETITDLAQSDLNHPDRLVKKGDAYKYNYTMEARNLSAFGQLKWNGRKMDWFLSGSLSQTQYRREGLYRNGYYPETSFGSGEKLNFTDFGIKSGAIIRLTGQHMVKINAAYLTQAPSIRNSYSNARQNGIPVLHRASEQIQLADIGYVHRSPLLKARITGFYNELKNATQIGFYFTQGLSGMGAKHDAAFVQEVTQGINQRNIGMEFGAEFKLTPTINLKAAGSFRQSIYTNNPDLYLTSEDFQIDNMHGEQLNFALQNPGTPLIFGTGKTYIKNYRLANGPEQVFQIGAEYRDPNYWFLGSSVNFFSNAFVALNKLRRTANFSRDADGLQINDYNPERARELLQQEKMDSYMLLNLVGGKSWRVNHCYIGIFGVVNNLLNQEYKNVGYESGRKANYTELNKDQSAPYGSQFGNRYFYGYGTTFYLNVYVRF